MTLRRDDSDHGSFTTGFTLGILSGAAGFFLFATKQGKKVREELSQEWESARDQLKKDGVIENAKASLSETVKSVMDNFSKPTVSSPIVTVENLDETSSKKSARSTKKRKYTRKTVKKFKGA